MTDVDVEPAALVTRASYIEAQQQAAEARGDVQAVQEYEIELSRLYSRACDLERQQVA